jgi:cytochrome c556
MDFKKLLGIEEETPVMLQQPEPVAPVAAPVVAPAPEGVEQQTAASLLSQYAEPRAANFQAPKIQIPAADPTIAAEQAKREADALERLKSLDADYKANMADAERRRFNSEIFATLGNYLPGIIAGATAMNTKASVKPADVPKIAARDTTGEVERKYKTDYEKLLEEYKAVKGKKDGQLTPKDQLTASIAQAYLEQGAARLNSNIENTDRNAGIRVGTAQLADQKANELTDKQVEAQTDLDNTLSEIGKVTKEAEKFKDYLGPNKAAYESLKEGRFGAIVPGKINEDYVKFRADAKALQGQYQKVISGLTVSDKEREELKSYIPNVEMPFETFKASAKAFEDRVNKLRKQTKGNQSKYQGKNVQGYKDSQTLSPQDQQALDWAKSNSSDPRAAAILKKLGM